MTETDLTIHKGLDGVIADETHVSKVNVEESQLYYRGYNINDLCTHGSFLETAYLLLYNELPTADQLAAFSEEERRNRNVPDEVYEIFRQVPENAHPMDYLRLGVSYLGLCDTDNELGQTSRDNIIRKANSLLAKIPTLLANGYRIVNGQDIYPPNPNLSYSENFLSMILGEVIHDPLKGGVFDTSLTLYAEHGFNASTFAARVTTSTLSDYYSAISSAIGTLKGPLHGGANEQVMFLLEEIGTPDQAEKILRKKLKKKEKIMGFGHRLYRTGDSRVPMIKKLSLKLAKKLGVTQWHEIGDIIENIMVTEKKIHPNLDFHSAMAYNILGIPIPLYTPLFVASRVTGWSAHILEQNESNRLIRPKCHYIGHEKRDYVPIDDR